MSPTHENRKPIQIPDELVETAFTIDELCRHDCIYAPEEVAATGAHEAITSYAKSRGIDNSLAAMTLALARQARKELDNGLDSGRIALSNPGQEINDSPEVIADPHVFIQAAHSISRWLGRGVAAECNGVFFSIDPHGDVHEIMTGYDAAVSISTVR